MFGDGKNNGIMVFKCLNIWETLVRTGQRDSRPAHISDSPPQPAGPSGALATGVQFPHPEERDCARQSPKVPPASI